MVQGLHDSFPEQSSAVGIIVTYLGKRPRTRWMITPHSCAWIGFTRKASMLVSLAASASIANRDLIIPREYSTRDSCYWKFQRPGPC
jgi:hypothetical protein